MTAASAPSQPLCELARRYGLQTAYVDLGKRRRAASSEALVAVLRSLGAPLVRAGDAAHAVRESIEVERQRIAPPVVVGLPGKVLVLQLQLPGKSSRSRVRVTAQLEDGQSHTQWAQLDRGPAGTHIARLNGPWPIGYHRVEIEAGKKAGGQAHVLIAPRKCHTMPPGERRWGTFLPLYALRMRGDSGAGDFSGLAQLLEWAGDQGADVVGTLPLLPAFLDEPCDPSPYSPVSRLFWNEFYVDPAATPEWPHSPDAQKAHADQRAAYSKSRAARHVDYRALMHVKRPILEALAHTCYTNAQLRERLDGFIRARPEVVDYAEFRAACERHGVPWTQWPARMRHGHLNPGDFDDRAYRYHVYVQSVAEDQLRSAANRLPGEDRGLYLDLPLGVNPDGYDTWRERDAFLTGLSAGAPPDPFFIKGQKWGLPPLNPHGLRRHGYRHWAACLRHHLRHAALLRIDHIMGLHRIFCVPNDMDATHGVYLRYPHEEFYAVLKIESHRAACAVAGEDLGTVPQGVRRSMRRNGVNRLYVMQFSFDGKRVGTPTADSVASLNTHDMAPFAAFYRGKDIAGRVGLGLLASGEARSEARGRAGMRKALTAFLKAEGFLAGSGSAADARNALRALLRFLAQGPAAMLLVNLEDLWLEEEQQNTPGTTIERRNWQLRASKMFEEFSRDPKILGIIQEIDNARNDRKAR